MLEEFEKIPTGFWQIPVRGQSKKRNLTIEFIPKDKK
jgi:hypothetical protein